MTLREEAYSLIDKLPDKVMEDVVRELRQTMGSPSTWKTPEQDRAERMEALRELEKMRQEAREYAAKYETFDPETAREEAMREKYGEYVL